MFSYKKNAKRGFTLIEMLIVIVIIGILAAALIPRLTSVRGRANDTARKADLQQIASALVAYQIDHGSFPTTRGSVNCISGVLATAGMSGLPTDPNKTRTIAGFTNPNPTSCIASGNYYYFPVSKGGMPNNGFVLVAASETEGGSNYSTAQGSIDMSDQTVDATYENISSKLCKSAGGFIQTASPSAVCEYNASSDQLRYLYLY